MRALVEELLLLARLDSGAHLETQPVDIGRLAKDVVADAAITNPSRQVTARIDDNVTAPLAGGHRQGRPQRLVYSRRSSERTGHIA